METSSKYQDESIKKTQNQSSLSSQNALWVSMETDIEENQIENLIKKNNLSLFN